MDSAIESLREYVALMSWRPIELILTIDSSISLNPHPTYIAHRTHLTPGEAPAIFKEYDLILDCTDNPATRYLISDTAVLTGKPLVSASALRTDGQLVVLNNPPRPPGDKEGGPCYRCVFPKPPPADSVVSCADGGIIGPVVGTMGVLQALEAIKVLTAAENFSASEAPRRDPPALHIFSAYSNPLFRTIRLRSRRPNCAVCSADATVSLDTIMSGSTDYVFFCGSASLPSLLGPDERLSPEQYRHRYPKIGNDGAQSIDKNAHIMIDVRDQAQFGICNLENSINVPISNILASASTMDGTQANGDQPMPSWIPQSIVNSTSNDPIYVVCRLGNDSQIAVKRMKDLGLDRNGQRFIGDIRGGFRAWREQIEPTWPEY